MTPSATRPSSDPGPGPRPVPPPYTGVPATGPAGWPVAAVPGLDDYLDACAEDHLHPDDVARRLVRAGWPRPVADRAAGQYRLRFDEHPVGYATLLISIGVACLALGSSAHLLLDRFTDRGTDAELLAGWLTALVVALPVAVVAWRWAERVDKVDPAAAWSSPRRTLGLTLVWACVVVGGGRLLVYVHQLMGVLTGASWADTTTATVGSAHVAVTVAIAGPLGWWAWSFLQRHAPTTLWGTPGPDRRTRGHG